MNGLLSAGWQLAAGIGIFLLGMSFLEGAFESLGGRRFRRLLREHTANPLKAVFAGTLATAILQSSSVISLIVLAFVGAQMIEMRNALGIIIGANLGTTFTGWIVAIFGFKLNIEAFSYPLIASGLIVMLMTNRHRKLHNYAKTIAGFGLLFFGLGLMKGAMEGVSGNVHLETFSSQGILVFFLVGFLVTAVIQSSSACMALALSALSMNLIDLHSAAAVVIGADLGTTSTVLIGAANGLPAKKQVAFFHFLFNLVVDSLALLSLPFLLAMVQWLIPSGNPLFVLVGFHNLFNVFGIILFLPFLGAIGGWLEKRFVKSPESPAIYITLVDPRMGEASSKALSDEVERLISLAIELNTSWTFIEIPGQKAMYATHDDVDPEVLKTRYSDIKRLEGEILHYMAEMRSSTLPEMDLGSLNSWTMAVRDAVRSVKAIKNIRHDFQQFEFLHQAVEVGHYQKIVEDLTRFYRQVIGLRASADSTIDFEDIIQLKQLVEEQYNDQVNAIYASIANRSFVNRAEISTFLNVIRQIQTSNHALLDALKAVNLTATQIRVLESLPSTVG